MMSNVVNKMLKIKTVVFIVQLIIKLILNYADLLVIYIKTGLAMPGAFLLLSHCYFCSHILYLWVLEVRASSILSMFIMEYLFVIPLLQHHCVLYVCLG